MKLRPAVTATILGFAIAGFAWSQHIVLSVPTDVRRGDAFSVAIAPGGAVLSATVELRNPAGSVVVTVPAFRVMTVRDVPVMVAILAVDSTDPVGKYTVRASIESGPSGGPSGGEGAAGAKTVGASEGNRSTLESVVNVVDREFRHEDIKLDSALSDLRETPDPRQVAEAREILSILAKVDTSAVYSEGDYELPVADPVETSHFGDRRVFLYTDGQSARAIHYGLDLAVPEGTPVHAAAAGKVMFAGPRIISGNTVVIEHLPGVYGLYYHMSKLEVKAGEMVGRGQVIGQAGMTGLATGPHLHWEIRVDGIPVEPTEFLSTSLIDKASLFLRIVNAEK